MVSTLNGGDRRNSALARAVPGLSWITAYDRRWLRGDLIAGATTAAVVIPQAMAYAAMAGLPVEVGLYASTVPMLVYALLGTSRCLSVSVTSTVSILTAEAIAGSDDPAQRAALLAIIVGLILLIAGFLKLGFVARFISQPVLTGFKAGAGLLIAASQLSKVLGMPVAGDKFFDRIRSVLSNLDAINWWTLGFALAGVAFLIALKQAAPRLPGPILLVALGIIVMRVSNLAERGVATVGEVPSGLPSFGAPAFNDTASLVGPALGISLMAFVESISAARAFVRPDEPPVVADRELVALGAASFSGGFFHAYPTSGGLSQTAVNRNSGARTQLAAVSTVVVVALTLTILTPLVADLPQALLGAIVLVAAAGLVDVAAFERIARIRRRDAILGLVTLAAVLVFGVLAGVVTGVLASMLTLLYETNHTPVDVLARDLQTGRWEPVDELPDAQTSPGVLVVRPYGPLYFGNAEPVTDQIRAMVDRSTEPVRAVVIDASAIPDFEMTGLYALSDLVRDLGPRGISIRFARMLRGPRSMLERALIERGDAPIAIFSYVDEAVADAQTDLPQSP